MHKQQCSSQFGMYRLYYNPRVLSFLKILRSHLVACLTVCSHALIIIFAHLFVVCLLKIWSGFPSATEINHISSIFTMITLYYESTHTCESMHSHNHSDLNLHSHILKVLAYSIVKTVHIKQMIVTQFIFTSLRCAPASPPGSHNIT